MISDTQPCPNCGHVLLVTDFYDDDAVLVRCTFVPSSREVGHDWMPLPPCEWFSWRAVA